MLNNNKSYHLPQIENTRNQDIKYRSKFKDDHTNSIQEQTREIKRNLSRSNVEFRPRTHVLGSVKASQEFDAGS